MKRFAMVALIGVLALSSLLYVEREPLRSQQPVQHEEPFTAMKPWQQEEALRAQKVDQHEEPFTAMKPWQHEEPLSAEVIYKNEPLKS